MFELGELRTCEGWLEIELSDGLFEDLPVAADIRDTGLQRRLLSLEFVVAVRSDARMELNHRLTGILVLRTDFEGFKRLLQPRSWST